MCDEYSDVYQATYALLEQYDAAVEVRTEVIWQPLEVQAVLQTPLNEECDEEGIVLPEERIPVEFTILLRKVIRVGDRGLAEG
jgi:hypothetical protein